MQLVAGVAQRFQGARGGGLVFGYHEVMMVRKVVEVNQLLLLGQGGFDVAAGGRGQVAGRARGQRGGSRGQNENLGGLGRGAGRVGKLEGHGQGWGP